MLAVVAVIGIVIAGLFIFVINRAVDEIGQNFGVANPGDYEVAIEDCSVDNFDDVQASGTLRNNSDRTRAFTVEVRFLDSNGDLITSSTSTTDSLDPGQRGNWSIVTFDEPPGGRFTCEVDEVTYFGS